MHNLISGFSSTRSLVFSVLIAIFLLGGRDAFAAGDWSEGLAGLVGVSAAALTPGAGGPTLVPLGRQDEILFPNWWSYGEFLTYSARKGGLFPKAYTIGALIASFGCAGVLLWVMRRRGRLAPQIGIALFPSFLGGLLTIFQFSYLRYVLGREGWAGAADPIMMAVFSMGSTVWGVLSSLFLLAVLFSFFVFQKRRGEFSRRDGQRESPRSITEV